MKAGSRIAVDEKKRHPMDFVLWKGAKPGEPQWPSPWGPGRPGWHIECSVMSSHYLGDTFDIHGGGRDLLFPHHENERAQSVAAHGGGFARYWVHNGFVTVESEKMSKSLGNFLTIRDALKTYHPEVLRLFLLSKHYREPAGLLQGQRAGASVRPGAHLQDPSKAGGGPGGTLDPGGATGIGHADRGAGRLLPGGVCPGDGRRPEHGRGRGSALREGEGDEPPHGCRGTAPRAPRCAPDCRPIAGSSSPRPACWACWQEDPAEFFSSLSSAETSVPEAEIERLIQERTKARTEKRWADADAIRAQLKGMGIVLEDGPKGTTWRRDV